MKKWHKLGAGILLLVSLMFVSPSRSNGKALEIDVLDVGQGDSILIKTPNDHKILIDGGPDASVVQQLDEVLPFWDRSIDAIVPTHPQADHIIGLVSVIQHFHVKKVLATPAVSKIVAYAALQREISLEKLPQLMFLRGATINLDDGIKVQSLWPTSQVDYHSVKDLNDVAQICKLTFNDFSALFTADAGANIDQQLDALGDNQKITFLKVPHHGSRTGMDEHYLNELDPLISVISVGADNRYGHPTASALSLLANIHSRVYRTDRDGRVSVRVDGAGISLKTSNMKYN